MFGLGYVGAEDRLFVMDALRNAGRGQLSAFAGGSAGNRAQDHTQWEIAPYTEADLQRQFDLGDDVYGAAGAALQEDVTNYVAGINRYIHEARVNPLKMPGEYAAIGKPGPQDWKVTDVIATASLIGGIFGKGGGRELDSALLLQDTQQRFGRKRGKRVWADLRTAEDPEAPVTVNPGKRFPYRAEPRRLRRGGAALPDRGSVHKLDVVKGDAAASTSDRDDTGLGGMLSFPRQGSNALLVSARESKSGKPIAVMGPQTAYFAPQLLMDVDVHGPGIDARGATFAGISLYVLLGHGRDYAWSATSAGQDIIDTFALPLCEPDGSAPTVDSMHYVFNGQCTADRGAREDQQLDPEPGRRHAARLGDAPRRAHEARPGDRPGEREGQAGALHEAALHLLPRGRLGARLRRAERPEQDPRRRRTSSARPPRSASRSTGSTSTTRTSATSTRATTRCARRARARTSR